MVTAMGIVESVNIGPAVDVPWGKLKRSGIDKRPVEGPVQVHARGVGDDEVADQVFHGGPDQAVYAYAAEDLEFWSADIGREVRPGEFGENLTTRGIDLTNAHAGDRWRVGGALLELAGVRIPCSVFQGFVDETQWIKRFIIAGRPGPYFRVLEPGPVAAGDAVEIVEQRDHEVTMQFLFRALTTERALVPRLAAEPRIAPFVERRLGGRRNKAGI